MYGTPILERPYWNVHTGTSILLFVFPLSVTINTQERFLETFFKKFLMLEIFYRHCTFITMSIVASNLQLLSLVSVVRMMNCYAFI